jgi:predicted transposase/invertase (TIGR01784 family)
MDVFSDEQESSRVNHDQLFKELLTMFFFEFVDLFLPQMGEYLDRSEITFLPQEYFTDNKTGSRRAIDVLVQVKFRGQDTCFLIHVENQSYDQDEFDRRLFFYFAMLYKEYQLPVYPIAIFSFDYPLRVQSQQHQVNFPDLKVLEFNFASIQLNQLNWRDFLQQQNPVAAALMAKMRIQKKDRPKVKAECLRLLVTLKLDPAKTQLISKFVDTYLDFDGAEEQQFQAEIDKMDLGQKEEIMEVMTSWEKKGMEKGIEKGVETERKTIALSLLRENLPLEMIARTTGLTIEQLQDLQAEVVLG